MFIPNDESSTYVCAGAGLGSSGGVYTVGCVGCASLAGGRHDVVRTRPIANRTRTTNELLHMRRLPPQRISRVEVEIWGRWGSSGRASSPQPSKVIGSRDGRGEGARISGVLRLCEPESAAEFPGGGFTVAETSERWTAVGKF